MILDEFCTERYIPQALADAFAHYLIGEADRLEDLTGHQLQNHWKTFARTLSHPDKLWLLDCVKKGLIAYGREMLRAPTGLQVQIEVLAGQGFAVYLYRCPKPIIIGWN